MARCHLDPVAGLPTSVIAKWLRDDQALGLRADPSHLATEAAALEFLAQIGFPSVPRLIGSDLEAGVLILEDLSPCVALADLLRAEGPEASEADLIDFARVLGDLGAATVGRHALLERLRRRAAPIGGPAGHLATMDSAWPRTQRILARRGLEMPGAVERELAAVAETLAAPGPFRAFSNGDPHPNNFLVGEHGGRLIDFESAGFVHALTGAVWIHTPDPAWITAAQSKSAQLEAAFRAALAAGIPEAEDDRLFGLGMAACCLAWALTRLARFETLDGRPAGDRSRRQMVATLELAAAAARRHRSLPALAGWAERAAAWLRRRWPDSDVDFAGYPAFTPR